MSNQSSPQTNSAEQRIQRVTAKAVISNKCCGEVVTIKVAFSNAEFEKAQAEFNRLVDPNSPESQAKVNAAMQELDKKLAAISEQYSLKNKLLGYASTAVDALKDTFTNFGGTARGIGGSVVNFGPDVVNLFGDVGRYGAGGLYFLAGGIANTAGRVAGYGDGGGDEAFARAQEYFNNPELAPWRLDPLYKPQEGIEQFWYTMSPMNWWPAGGGRTIGGKVVLNTSEGVLQVSRETMDLVNGILTSSKTPAQAVKNFDAAIEAARKSGASAGDLAALEQARMGVANGKIKPNGKPGQSGMVVNSKGVSQVFIDRQRITKLSQEAAQAEKNAAAAKARGDTAAADKYEKLAKANIEEARDILKPYIPGGAKNPAGDWGPVLERLDVNSPKDGSYFWSGNGGKDAQRMADASAGVRMETTPGGKIVDGWIDVNNLPWDAKSGAAPPYASDLWGGLSSKYAQGASGEINVVQTADKYALGGGDVWRKYELPILSRGLANGTVTRINIYEVTPTGPVLRKTLP